MKIKRILPVIAAVAILCSMMIVPASAAYESPSQYYSYADVSIELFLEDDSSYILPAPNSFLTRGDSWSTSLGNLPYSFSSSSGYNSVTSNFNFELDEFAIDQATFCFSDFVIDSGAFALSTYISFFRIPLYADTTYSWSFDVLFVNHLGKIQSKHFDCFYFSPEDSDTLSLLGDSDLLSVLDEYDSEDVVYITDMALSVDYGNPVDTLSYSTAVVTDPYFLYSVDDFLFDNGIVYGQNIFVESDSFDALDAISGFLTGGVGAFLDTPMFGIYTLGDILYSIIGVLIVLFIIRMFSN